MRKNLRRYQKEVADGTAHYISLKALILQPLHDVDCPG